MSTTLSERDKEKFILERSREEDTIDTAFGYARLNDSNQNEKRCGYLFNMKPSSFINKETTRLESAVDYYFIQQDGATFRATVSMHPYFYLGVKPGAYREVDTYLRRRFQDYLADVCKEEKVDLEQKNHLSGITRTYMRLSFFTVQDLLKVRGDLQPLINKNKATEAERENTGVIDSSTDGDAATNIVDIREYDVTYYTRCSIDQKTRCGEWYNVIVEAGEVLLELRKDLGGTAPPFKVFAFDIECTKKPLKFPDADAGDEVMMISYMVNGQGYLIISREHVGEDIADFEYTPLPEYPGPFKVFNEPNERALLNRFVSEIKRIRPHIFVTYNGDFFDWPFVEKRAKHLGISLKNAIGLYQTEGKDSDAKGDAVYTLHYAPHLDAYKWVQRDSYLPHGSQGLKEVTRLKLHYNPLEVNPEEMVEKAKNDPQVMSAYSVSDAVATYYLYKKYVEPFIFSLCTIIPMSPDDVLRKGTGTLCETLLMVKAQSLDIIFPNKHSGREDKFYKGHLLESETYVGGHVESLVSGVFRSDLDLKFDVVPTKVEALIQEVDQIIQFFAETEARCNVADILNYAEVRAAIIERLVDLKETPHRIEKPLIYHVDVASMYPNIILTNRLQPTAIVDDATCAVCIHNRPENNCKKKMDWKWCIDYLPNNKGEYNHIKDTLGRETFSHLDEKTGETRQVPYYKLAPSVQSQKLRSRLKDFCKKTYKKSHIVETLEKKDTVCMRENPFYVDTVRDFRDRRIELKNLWKDAMKNLDIAKKNNSPASVIEKAERMVIYYESLQLAHKCILNSFYGYVVRKGARWYSMEMAGIVTDTGSAIIKRTRETVEKIGRPLELDTDGIWAAIPASWPDNFEFKLATSNRPVTMSFLCTLLNREIHEEFTNDQYQTLTNTDTLEYETRKECTIFFEVDGPYRAMVIPKSTEEEKQLKKRYVVFDEDGEIAELKGFEIKRRGELKLIKNFQKEVFKQYLEGKTLQDCYAATAVIANHFLDIIKSRGESMDDEELLELISESRSMSRKLSDYKQAKSMTVTTANRLGQLLGAETVKDAGVNCSWIVSKLPPNTPVTQRAIPIIIFNADPATKKKLLSQWLKTSNSHVSLALRDIVDWTYYEGRLATTVQKMVTLPAFLQGVDNPVPRVKHPEWILRRKREQDDKFKQKDLLLMWQGKQNDGNPKMFDIEDLGDEMMGKGSTTTKRKKGTKDVASWAKKGKKRSRDEEADIVEDELKKEKAELGPQPDQEKDYHKWLAWQKARWDLQKKERKRRRMVYGQNAARTKSGMNVDSYFQKKQMQFKEKPWNILQVCTTTKPGILKIWVLSPDGDLASMQLAVWNLIDSLLTLQLKRKFYVNCYKEKQNPLGSRSLSLLPRQRQRHVLYECECDEDIFISNSREIALQRVDPSVEGLYESKVPLDFRAICELGCVCSVAPAAKSHNASLPWDLSQLEKRQSTAEYLTTAPRYVYLYISRTSDSNFATFGLHFSHLSEVQFVFYTCFVEQERASVKQSFEKENSAPDISFKSTYKFNFAEAVDAVRERLVSYKAEHPGATILVLQTYMPKSELVNMLPIIDDFPHMQVQFRKKDNKYPAFSWAQQAAATFGKMTLHIQSQIDRKIQMARYGNVPFCNLADESNIFVADVMYSRFLKQTGHVLWYSDSPQPDLGGNEDYTWEELKNPVVCNPTVTKTLTLEVDITGLAINTLLQASHIEGMENLLKEHAAAQAKLKFDAPKAIGDTLGSDIAIDEVSACQSAARVMSQLISKWSGDLFENDNTNTAAHELWSTFYRWISSSQSKLYDSALHKLVHKMITQVFYTMVTELHKFCETDSVKMILGTDKVSKADGEAHFKFVKRTLCKQPLFRYVSFKAKMFWEVLLFKDPENYIGYLLDNSGKPKAFWSLANFLPDNLQSLFMVSLGKYMSKLHEIRPTTPLAVRTKNLDAEQDQDGEDLRGTSGFQMDQQLSAIREKQLSAEERAALGEIKRTLLEHTTTAMRVAGQGHEPELAKLVSADLPLNNQTKNYPLEFVKHICYALSLNKDHEMEINAIKAIVNSREFSAEAEFVDPGISYVLPDLICDYCNHCRDIDLLRDRRLVGHSWTCADCSHTLDSSVVENRLVDIARNQVASFQGQDMSCVKCNSVKRSYTLLICPQCSGKFTNRHKPEESIKVLSILLLIAKFHHFHNLQEIVETALQFTK